MSVSLDKATSARLFVDVVWPALHPYIGGSAILSDVESRTDAHSKQLDRQAGIDYWVTYDGGMYPVAARVRSAETVYNDFTIRKYSGEHESEWFKVARAIQRGALRPALHVIAYVDRDAVVRSAAAVRTDLLWAMAERLQLAPIYNGHDGNPFIAVPYTQFTKNEALVIGDKAPAHMRRDITPAPFIEETLWR